MRAAQPLAPRDRGPFLQDLADALKGRNGIGDGELFRAIREVQRRHWDAPVMPGHEPHGRRATRAERV